MQHGWGVAKQGVKPLKWRHLCNGKTLAFQAKDTGSIPVARSKIYIQPIDLYKLYFCMSSVCTP